MPCQQETPSWPSRSSNGISFSPWRSRESPQTHARNLSSPSILSSPSSCPRPSLKFNGNEPTDAPLTCFLSASEPLRHVYAATDSRQNTWQTSDWGFFFCLNENKFYLLYFLQCFCLLMLDFRACPLCDSHATEGLHLHIAGNIISMLTEGCF